MKGGEMKAIKDCEWRVGIKGDKIVGIDWRADTNDFTGIINFFQSRQYHYKSKKSTKRNWEKFAKLNGIKKWQYI